MNNLRNLTQYKVIAVVSILFTIFYNISFFRKVIETYQVSSNTILSLVSVPIFLLTCFVLIFTIFSSKHTTKPILILTLIASSFTSYFMDSYHVVIDDDMIRNIAQTDLDESLDLFNFKLVLYVLFLGILPSFIIYRTKINYLSLRREVLSKVRIILACLVVILVIFFAFSKFYTSFFREHKPLRYYTNPTYWIYSVGSFIGQSGKNKISTLSKIGIDSDVNELYEDGDKKELVIMVVGEAARADRFSLNGYKKETNPNLKKEGIINFTNVYSCGTSTAVSVPCMFSIFDKDDYSHEKGLSTQNILDVLNNTKKIDILWRDNNSDSKGVALRVDFEDYKTSKNNTICDDECRDEGMLVGLDKYIEDHKGRDILIVLHQMGNHGPAYYKRYPKKFEKFTPVCKTNQLEECSAEEIGNAYDNAILYTDYFLSKTINFLKKYSKTHETAMIYMSDHGESLGENGLYLHGLPYFMAPDNQIHIASLMWLGSIKEEDIDERKLSARRNEEFSQDNLFHTLLGIFEVESEVYDKEKDILNGSRKN